MYTDPCCHLTGANNPGENQRILFYRLYFIPFLVRIPLANERQALGSLEEMRSEHWSFFCLGSAAGTTDCLQHRFAYRTGQDSAVFPVAKGVFTV